MALTPTRPVTDSATDARAGHARLRLKPRGPVTGRVDGAWWPASTDLAAELPALLVGLGDRLGLVERISYHLGDWAPGESRVQLDRQLVRTGGFHAQQAHTVDVLDRDGRLTLLVVPSDTAADQAGRALAAGADPADTGSVEELLGRTR